jgi:hypothetical protein
MNKDHRRCPTCGVLWAPKDCIELSIAGPSHLICRNCASDLQPVVPPTTVIEPESTIERRIKQAQGVKP